ncbi:hypothetical protein [Paraburkholderia caffeinilytica]|uniref:hypothetical protein n=1 Tax=Paraburkholderia caffeinilytica TaxID=1761016 RepID=UPI003DA1AA51
MNPDTLKCPYCQTSVRRDTHVCPGCQAFLRYGAPDAAYGLAVIAGAAAGFISDMKLPSSLAWISWPVGLMVLAGAGVLIRRLYRHHVEIRRAGETWR